VRDSKEAAFGIARLLADHKGADVVVLDLASQAGWTDYFVIATATSGTHLRSLARCADEYAAEGGMARLNRAAVADDEEWALADLGTVVVHVMTERARAFYELEKLWFQARATRVEPELPPAAAPAAPGGAPKVAGA
jgi:ribosome-associated protein